MLRNWGRVLILGVLLLKSVSAYDFKQFDIHYKKDIRSLDDAQIRSIVESSLKDVLEADPYYKAISHVYSNSRYQPEFLITYLLRSDCLLYESYKISLGEDGTVTNVTSKFEQPISEEEIRADECRTCPDPEVEVYIESCMDGAPLGAAEWCFSVALGAGYKTVKHIAADATTANFKAYLDCPKLKCVIHVGHGNNEKGILLADTDIRHEWFAAQEPGYLDQQVHLYGSCLVQNDPFKSAILHTGVEAFMGGITTIDIVTLQNTMYFISQGMFYGKEVKESFLATDAVSHGWGISGNPPNGPWYVDFDDSTPLMQKELTNNFKKSNKYDCVYNKFTKSIDFNLNQDLNKENILKIDLYSSNGRFIKNAFNGKISKDLSINTSELAQGIYLLKVKGNEINKSFSIMIN